MFQLELYGKRSSRYEYLKQILTQKFDEHQIIVSLSEYHDVQDFMRENVTSIPAIRINGQFMLECQNEDDITAFSTRVFDQILQLYQELGSQIVVPFDFSKNAENALHLAKALASAQGSGVHILHALQPQPVEVNGAIWVNPEARDTTQKRLKEYVLKQASMPPLAPLTYEVLEGFPTQAIVEVSARPSVRMMVMGTRGENTPLRRWLGTVSEEVALHACCPVLVVPPRFDQKMGKILFATDVSHPTNTQNFRFVEGLARDLGTEILMLHVRTDQEHFQIVSTNGRPTTVPVRQMEVENTDIVSGLLQTAQENECGLITLLTRKRTIFNKIMHKSTTKGVYSRLNNQALLVLHEDNP